jgi:hypothetical protein
MSPNVRSIEISGRKEGKEAGRLKYREGRKEGKEGKGRCLRICSIYVG